MIGAWMAGIEEARAEPSAASHSPAPCSCAHSGRRARGEAAFLRVPRDRGVERGHRVGGRREAPLRGLLHVDPLVVQVQASEGCWPSHCSGVLRLTITRAHARHALEALARAATTTSNGVLRASISSAPGSSWHRRSGRARAWPPPARSRAAGCTRRHSVSRCTTATWVMPGSAASARSTIGRRDLLLLGVVDGDQLAAQHLADLREALAVGAVAPGHQHVAMPAAPRCRWRPRPRRCRCPAALAFMRAGAVHDLQHWRRMRAVIWLKSPSHEPQSRSTTLARALETWSGEPGAEQDRMRGGLKLMKCLQEQGRAKK